VASAVAPGAVVDTDLLPLHLPFLPSERGDESLEPPPQAVHRVVAGSVIGFAAYHWLLGNVATPPVSTYTFVNPVVAMLLGTIFLRETFSTAMIFGAGLVLASIIVMWRSEHATAFGPRKELARAG
jgi:drug/metabolite transporter (DMT)-like permease